MPVGQVGGARVEIVGDVSKFARQVQDDLNRALRGIRVDPVEVRGDFDRVQREARDAADSVETQFERSGEEAEDALKEVGDAGERQFDRIEREARDAGSRMSRVLGGAAVGIGAAFAAVQIGQFLGNAVQAADDLSDAMAISEQVIEQTGGAAGLLATEVREISRSLSLEIAVDSVQVQDAANVLLTFQGVSEEVFGRSLSAAADLSTLFGTDLRGATLQLGKALQDPIRGINALSRSGVNFTQAQREQIEALVESNDLLGAQEIILANVEAQVGGAAAVAADSWSVVANTFREVQRALGAALIPALDAVAPVLITLAESLQEPMRAIGEVLGSVLEQIAPIVGVLGTALAQGLEALLPAVAPLGEALLSIVAALAPLLPVIGELIGTLLPPFAQIVQALAEPLGVVAQILGDTLTQALAMIEPHLPAIVALFGQIAVVMAENLQQTLPIVAQLFLDLLTAILPLIPDLIELTEALLPFIANVDFQIVVLRLLSDILMLAVIPAIEMLSDLLQGDFAGAFPVVTAQLELMRSIVESVFSFVSGFISDSVGRARSVLNGIGSVVSNVIGFFTNLRDGARDKFNSLLELVRGLPGRIVSAIGNLSSLLRDAGRNVIQGFLDGIRGMIPDLSGLLGGITDMIPDIKGPPERDRQLLRNSGRLVMQGFQHGIEDERDNIRRQLQGMTADIGAPGFVGQVAGGDGATAAGSVATAEAPIVQVFIDGREIEGAVVRVVDRRDRDLSRRIRAGSGRIR